MTAILKLIHYRKCASSLAFILLWMAGVASLTHTDGCDDCDILGATHSHCSSQTPQGVPDICAACAWNAASQVCLPMAVIAPAQGSFVFVLPRTNAVRTGKRTVPAVAPRGPPEVA